MQMKEDLCFHMVDLRTLSVVRALESNVRRKMNGEFKKMGKEALMTCCKT
jgi:hypothetical protein